MKSSLRVSTALVTSLSLAMTHMPTAAFAQSADDVACLDGESAEACLARALEEAAAVDVGAAAEAARLAEEAAVADAQAVEAARLAEEAAVADAQTAEAARIAVEADAAAALAEIQAAAAQATEAAVAEQLAQEADTAAQVEAEAAQATADAEAARLAEEAAAAEAAALAATDAESATAAAEAEAQAVAEAAALAEAEAAAAAAVETPSEATPVTDEAALAAALEAASGETPVEAEAEADAQTAEEATALEAAAIAAAEAEQVAAPDPVVEAEAEVEGAAVEAEAQMQSLALADDAAPVGDIVTEVITEESSRSADEEFEAIISAEPTPDAAAVPIASADSGRGGLSTLEAALLAGAAGLVIGSIVAGNRQVVNRADDRVVVLRPDGDYQVIRDDDVLLRRPGNGVSTENFADGSSRSIVTQPDGSQVITIRDRDLRILRRTVVSSNGTRTVLIDDTAAFQPVVVSQLPQARPIVSAPLTNAADASALRQALEAQQGYDRSFSLSQIRSIRAVRDLAPAVDLESVTFASGSAAIGPEQARALLGLGTYMSEAIIRNPQEVFLVEGHTDAVGGAAFNLALSDRRAESVALALSEYFGVAAQNMVVQGYGEDYLRVPILAAERLNRRVAVRRITTLLQVAAAN